jgi:DNA-binding transcriptional ArsR family regulator
MLRMLFSADDIARTRIAPRPDPLWEVMLGLHMLRRQPGDLLFGEWRRQTVEGLGTRMLRDHLRLLLALSPPVGYFPDFLTPLASSNGLEPGMEAIRSTPVTQLRRDLQQLAETHRLPASTSRLAQGVPTAMIELTQGLRTFHDVAITPHQRRIEAALDRDRGIRVQAMRDGGVEGLFASLRPMVRWSAGELQVPTHRDQEVHLGGRGLLLIPSYFNIVTPLTLFDASLPPVLIYPVERSPATVVAAPHDARGSLGPLIGHTRTAVLQAVGTGSSTSDLARKTGVSIGSASEHASVLRAAGLITSYRDRNWMIHRLTALGAQLLHND